MKKILLTIMCATVLNISHPKPAVSGLIIDPAAIAQNIGGTAQTIFDMAVQDILQKSILKELSIQGFSLASLKNFAESQLRAYVIGLAEQKLQTLLKPTVSQTKAKNTELLTQERDAYAEAAKLNASAKLGVAVKQHDETGEWYTQKMREKIEWDATGEMRIKNAQIKREELRGKGGREEAEAIEALEQVLREEEEIETAVGELKRRLQQQGEMVDALEKEYVRMGTSQDPRWNNLNNRLKILEKEDDDQEIIIKADIKSNKNRDWAKLENANGFEVGGDIYREFIEAYFYEPSAGAYTELSQGGGLQSEQQKLEAKKDKILRQRKYLLVNTAAHLLQVSATIRREKPVREFVVKKWVTETTEEADEINATTAYSNTRIENSRALLLYARLLTAKMQYNAAKEINGLELEKFGKIDDNKYSELDLDKYVLTKEEVEDAIKSSNKGEVIESVLGAAFTE